MADDVLTAFLAQYDLAAAMQRVESFGHGTFGKYEHDNKQWPVQFYDHRTFDSNGSVQHALRVTLEHPSFANEGGISARHILQLCGSEWCTHKHIKYQRHTYEFHKTFKGPCLILVLKPGHPIQKPNPEHCHNLLQSDSD